MDKISREAAHASGRKRYFTGEPCRNGHVAERATNNGACLGCVKATKERFADRNGRRYRRNHGEPERKEAAAAGLPRYSTGQPCRNGHKTERYTSTGKCIECESAKQRRYYEADPAKRYTQTLASRHRNPIPTRVAAKRWNAKNPERKRFIQRASTLSRRGKLRALGAVSTSDAEAVFQRQKGGCANCGKKAKKMEIDHILPLAKGGRSERRNLQLLCLSCNRRKSAKDPLVWAAENGLLV